MLTFDIYENMLLPITFFWTHETHEIHENSRDNSNMSFIWQLDIRN